MSDEQLPDKVRIKYLRPDGLRAAFASGVDVRLTPYGHINLMFYYDTISFPATSIAKVVDGYLESENEATEDDQIADVTREVNASVVLDPDSIMHLHEALKEIIGDYSDLFSSVSAEKADSDE